MKLFFSGDLSREEQLEFLENQFKLNNELLSATYAHRWGILRGAYAKLLEEIKEKILQNCN